VRVLFHSLAFGALKPLTGEGAAVQRQIEMTADVMGHSLVYWVQDVLAKGLMTAGGRIYAMTSEGMQQGRSAVRSGMRGEGDSGAHIRQLAMELAGMEITANAIMRG